MITFNWMDNRSKDDLYFYKSIFIDKLKDYGGLGFIHATSVKNLPSIIKEKHLYSRNLCKEEKISFHDNASLGVLNKTSEYIKSCVRFYFRPRTQALYDFNISDNICLLIFNYKILCSNFNGYIIDRIATSYDKKKFNIGKVNDMMDVCDNFNFEYTFNKNYVDRSNKYKWDCKAAELLIPDSVSLNQLKEIVFPNEHLERKYKYCCKDIKTSVKPELF